jgi:ABC-type uncharacterized transport system fused permease/ATPase subunit
MKFRFLFGIVMGARLLVLMESTYLNSKVEVLFLMALTTPFSRFQKLLE